MMEEIFLHLSGPAIPSMVQILGDFAIAEGDFFYCIFSKCNSLYPPPPPPMI